MKLLTGPPCTFVRQLANTNYFMVVVVYFGHLSGNCQQTMANKSYNFMKKNSEYDLIKKEIDDRGKYDTWSLISNIVFKKVI